MIAYLKGRVVRSAQDQVVLETAGVGYLVSIPVTARERVSQPEALAELHIHTHVREDQISLYGFTTIQELDLFQRLIQVDGVGPKVALAILGTASIDVLKRAILAGEVGPIRRASGVGPRTAQKVIIDLRPQLEAERETLAVMPMVAAASDRQAMAQVEAALRGLGFSAPQARQGAAAVDWAVEPDPEQALATALRALGRER